MTVHDLKLRLRGLIARRRSERELDEELVFHIERETQKLISQGATPGEARTRARARFGPVPLAADECRDARGTAFVDNCVRDILYALRTFRRAPLAALTIVMTVAVGLGLVAGVFTLFNIAMFRVDAVRNPGELFGVERPRTPDDNRVLFTQPEYEALRRETSVFTDAFAMLGRARSRVEGRLISGTLVTGNFFQVLGVSAARGRALMPEDDQPFAGRPVVVLSHRGWTTRFGSDPAVIGRALEVNGFSYAIVGVMPDGFRGLSFSAPDYWAPLSLLGQFRGIMQGGPDPVTVEIVGRLKPGMSRQTALAGLAVWDSGRTAGNPAGRGINVTLEPRQGTLPQPGEVVMVFTPLFFVFGLILAIGCANVANLLLARAVSRQREIGVRLSLGATRQRIIRQLLTESLLLAFASAALGFVISRIAITATIYAFTSTMAPEIAEQIRIGAFAADWRVVVFLVVGAVFSTAFFGLAPALKATRVELVTAARGEIAEDARPGRARNVLIGVQVTASALLLICSAVFLRSATAAASVNPGIRTSDTLTVQIVGESFREAMTQAVLAEPAVTAVAASLPGTVGGSLAAFAQTSASPMAERAPGKSTITYKLVSPEYFGVLGIEVLRGRGFTQAERTADSDVAIVTDTASRRLWPNGNALGQTIHLESDAKPGTSDPDDPLLTSRTFTVVGVARDIAGFRVFDSNKLVDLYLPTNPTVARTSLTVRVQGDPEPARRALLQRLMAVDPNYMGEVRTLRTMAKMETYFLQIAFRMTFVLGGLALVLTLSGLFSVLSYLVEQRKKELSVRMALGATRRNVVGLVLSQSARPVGFGLLAGGGLAAGLATLLLATPAAETIGASVRVLDPVAYAGSLLCIIAACVLASSIPAFRAARIAPMKTLRQD
jgi:predicted permease